MANQSDKSCNSPLSGDLTCRLLDTTMEMRGFTPGQSSGHGNSSPTQQLVVHLPLVHIQTAAMVDLVIQLTNGNNNQAPPV
ncbi:unnamed protein product [Prunus armeniaca]|uniref:Uncharacterized protein n=1 Tax=Prunus armeniaca TaxID=36596 RepID=A0A6J5V7Y1_PRUAR|nr:unnamed protein product [Prunus armeniaca]